MPSYRCVDKESRDYVIDNIDKMVVKPANESGGYGMLIGPKSTQSRTREIRPADPRESAQLHGATDADAVDARRRSSSNRAEPRHLDLRPFILSGAATYVTTGGLTRVAMRKGSTVVNSSQGGGSKDTWVVDV